MMDAQDMNQGGNNLGNKMDMDRKNFGGNRNFGGNNQVSRIFPCPEILIVQTIFS